MTKDGSIEIEVKSASLDTLTVSIKALHVNNKQMTLAVFRQLPQLPLSSMFDENGTLKKHILWGQVRYKTDGGSNWAVIAKDDYLFRVDIGKFFSHQIEMKIDCSNCQKTKEYLTNVISHKDIILSLPQLFIAV